ncbi:MAG: hypothetical protein JO264_05845 [Acidisphaera sp.]|nr:hypothetical protein [Acidisphaera sp.]
MVPLSQAELDTFLHVFWAKRAAITDHIHAATGGVVQFGPFAGTRLARESSWGDGDIAAKLLGVYEQELHATLAGFARRRYAAIVNIGCAEGYYAVGLARLFPSTPVLAFDVSEAAQRITRANAAENGLGDQVSAAGFCGAEHLASLGARYETMLCVIDCEGFETELVTPAALAGGLKGCDFLIECHDFTKPGITNSLLAVLASSHEVVNLVSGGRDPNVFACLSGFDDIHRWLAVNEVRPCIMNWLAATARQEVRPE